MPASFRSEELPENEGPVESKMIQDGKAESSVNAAVSVIVLSEQSVA